jgi:diguanylate cyclase
MQQEKITLEKSSEYLRLALPYLSRFSLAITPLNYAVWYDYVSGKNLPLQHVINDLIKSKKPIDDDVVAELYRKYVDPTDLSRIDEAQKVLRSLAETVMTSIDSANGEVTLYESTLKKCQTTLNEDLDGDAIKSLVHYLGQSTTRMSNGNADLQKHLEESRVEAEKLRQELHKSRAEAQTDALTGLTNRKGFDDAIEKLRQEEGDSLGHACLLICDIDKFKDINDTYGHLLGDKVIKSVADVLKSQVKGKDIPTRFGGEEFIVLLPLTDLKGAIVVAETIRKVIERRRVAKPKTGEEIRRVTVSIGVTQFADNEDVKETIARADAALYQAKNNGRNRVEVILPPSHIKVVNQY